MIIDSHAHYSSPSYQKSFRYLALENKCYALVEGTLDELFGRLQQANIPCSIEPGINLASCQQVLNLSQRYPERIYPAVGVHPTRAIFEDWTKRKQLDDYAEVPGVVAIGETGLDYHYPRKEQHRLWQYRWFLYQLSLARKHKLPLILHIRDAHDPALRLLRHHPARKLGGVVHCFQGTPTQAEAYVKLGFHIGIGGALLQPEERAGDLWRSVERIPLDRILVETDAPYILPYCKDVLQSKQLRRARNTSLILPAVIEKIAQLKGLPASVVAQATTNNAIRLFRLPLKK